MVEPRVLVGSPTGEFSRRADFYDYLAMLEKPANSFQLLCHDRSPAHSRNLIIDEAKKNDCTHVLFIDDDMAFKSNALLQLLEHDVPIVSALYLSRAYPHQPLVFDIADEQTGACLPKYLDGPMQRLEKIVAAGFGFLLVKMSVFDKLIKPYVRLGELDCEQWCDDIGFFNRVRKARIQSYVDTQCRVGHIGSFAVWPDFVNGIWVSNYDTGGKGSIAIPQIVVRAKDEPVTA
jgi:hypothetical protein